MTYFSPYLLGCKHESQSRHNDLHNPVNAGSEEASRGTCKTDRFENLRGVVVDAAESECGVAK